MVSDKLETRLQFTYIPYFKVDLSMMSEWRLFMRYCKFGKKRKIDHVVNRRVSCKLFLRFLRVLLNYYQRYEHVV
jgi:hypothetical protein